MSLYRQRYFKINLLIKIENIFLLQFLDIYLQKRLYMDKVLIDKNGVKIGIENDNNVIEFETNLLSEDDSKLLSIIIAKEQKVLIYRTGMEMVNKNLKFREAYHNALNEIYKSN